MGEPIFRMQVLAAGHGDCLWIEYGDASAPSRMLVDAGTTGTIGRLRPQLDAVRTAEPSHALFLVTHIDADHIGGALAALECPEVAAQFREIWFNGRTHLNVASELEHFGAVQAERLTRALLDRQIPWNASVAGAALVRLAGQPLRSVMFAGARVTVLSPSPAELTALIPSWDAAVKAAGLDPAAKSEPPGPDAPGYEAYGLLDVAKLAATTVEEDSAPANGSSVAVLVEFEGKRLLLGADAHPSVLLEGIRQLQPHGPLAVDVFKLPHHGSAANVTSAMLDAVDARTVVFSSNGAYFKHPDMVAVARVLVRYRAKGVHLVFNYRSIRNEMWDSDSLRSHWNYTTEYGEVDAGVTIPIG